MPWMTQSISAESHIVNIFVKLACIWLCRKVESHADIDALTRCKQCSAQLQPQCLRGVQLSFLRQCPTWLSPPKATWHRSMHVSSRQGEAQRATSGSLASAGTTTYARPG